MRVYLTRLLLLTALLAHAGGALADDDDPAVERCLLEALRAAAPDETVGDLRLRCAAAAAPAVPFAGSGDGGTAPVAVAVTEKPEPVPPSALEQRARLEQGIAENPWALTAHKPNYFLFASFTRDPNEAPFRPLQTPTREPFALDEMETKFQISLKFPIVRNWLAGGDLYVAYTGTSWWQLYNEELSAPFRETNHEPEVFYRVPTKLTFGDFRLARVDVGFVHESNGQVQPLSRSWNRLFAQFVVEKGDFAFAFKPWYRLPESNKADPLQPSGDDNPDITDYLGHFELGAAWRWGENTFSAMTRRNFATDKGAIELTWSRAIGSRFKLYAQYFDGYGESLIDYNFRQERYGLGLAFGDVL